MENPIGVIAFLTALGLLYVVFPVVVFAYTRYSGTKTPICPETRERVDVRLDPDRAAKSAAKGRLDLRVTSCSLWPEHRGCAEGCTAQLH